MALKFFYNGIKETSIADRAARAPLQTCWYSVNEIRGYPDETITIYAREYCYGTYPNRWVGFSQGIKDAFKVENDTDIMTDYHETDRIRVKPDHPLYGQVKAAYVACQDRYLERTLNRKS
jgi:hypothetical protein